jgi:biofilm protein TabA
MAIIGRFPDVLNYFSKSYQAQIISEYLTEAMKDGSITNRRLFDLPVGTFEKFDIREEYYAVEQKFASKDREKCFFESHIKHIDIQLMVDGEELMECVHISKLKQKEDLSQERDLLIYHDYADTHKILLKQGDIAIFFPEDVHMGTQMYKNSLLCVKTVVKMPVNFFRL